MQLAASRSGRRARGRRLDARAARAARAELGRPARAPPDAAARCSSFPATRSRSTARHRPIRHWVAAHEAIGTSRQPSSGCRCRSTSAPRRPRERVGHARQHSGVRADRRDREDARCERCPQRPRHRALRRRPRLDLRHALALARKGYAGRPSIFGDDVLGWALARNGQCAGAALFEPRAPPRHAGRAEALPPREDRALPRPPPLRARGFTARARAQPALLDPVGARRPEGLA